MAKRWILIMTTLCMLLIISSCTTTDSNAIRRGRVKNENKTSSQNNSLNSRTSNTSTTVSSSEQSQQVTSNQAWDKKFVMPAPRFTLSGKKAFPDNTVFATWIMIWVGSSEQWWNPFENSGVRVFNQNGKWGSPNWNDDTQMEMHIKNIKNAGIHVVVLDLTNGTNEGIGPVSTNGNSKSEKFARLCIKYGLKMAFAFAGQSSEYVSYLDNNLKTVWDNYGKVGSTYYDAYYFKDGKPLVVDYTWEELFNGFMNSPNTVYRDKFAMYSADGSDKDRWGWQLKSPLVGSAPSKDSMYVTSSVKWGSEKVEGRWRKSISMFDSTFLSAAENKPRFVIVGSYDDNMERNSWFFADTSQADRKYQQRDIYGNVSLYYYYNRVSEWIKGKPTSIPGGSIKDGIYEIKNMNSDLMLGNADIPYLEGAGLGQVKPADDYSNRVFIYHLGNNDYRISRIVAGLSLDASNMENGTPILQKYDENTDAQKWKIVRDSKTGAFKIQNKLTQKYLDIENDSVDKYANIIQSNNRNSYSQLWGLIPYSVID